MKYAVIKKGVTIQLILVVALSGLIACDLLSNKPKKIEFLDKSFSVMMSASWSIRSDLNDTADLQMGNSFKEVYVIIISDNKMDFDKTSLGGHSNITRPFIKESLKNYHESGPEMLDNGKFRTLRYRLTGNSDGINVVYWDVTIETKEYYH